MKLSRRGKHTKHARRGRHTKRTGKHLGYKSKSKKVSGSKRYHRGNKRTYKRGKRFHRGGAICRDFESNVVFYVRKHGPFPEQPQAFNFTIELNDNNVATVKLVRLDNINIKFTITGTSTDVLKLLETPDAPIKIGDKNVNLKKLDDDEKNGIYDFCSDGLKNKDSFKKIIDKLNKLIGVISRKDVADLVGCEA